MTLRTLERPGTGLCCFSRHRTAEPSAAGVPNQKGYFNLCQQCSKREVLPRTSQLQLFLSRLKAQGGLPLSAEHTTAFASLLQRR